MPADEIYSVYAADSTVWIGTMKGLISIPFSAIKKNNIPPPIHFTNIKIWEKDTTLLERYDLKHDQNNLNIEFVGLTYRNRGNTNYQYRMLGVDTDWVNTITRFARFPQLQSGDYEFQVKAINEDGTESIQPASIKFSIAQPWWETWWFYTLIAFGLVGGTSFIFYNRFRRIQKEEKRKQEFNKRINELRSMALQAQMNPHFVFNALNAIQKFLTTNEQEQAMIYLARFAQLIRTIFEHSKEKEITLEEEIEFLELYLRLEKLRFKEKVEVQFTIDKSITDVDYDIKFPPLLIQPIIENAFKHGLMHKEEGGMLKLTFSKNENVLYCVIEDNGVGRKNAELMGEGKIKNQNPSGIITTQERLRIFNESLGGLHDNKNLIIEDLYDKKRLSLGTKIQINIKHT